MLEPSIQQTSELSAGTDDAHLDNLKKLVSLCLLLDFNPGKGEYFFGRKKKTREAYAQLLVDIFQPMRVSSLSQKTSSIISKTPVWIRVPPSSV